jgi:hypothetical protein
MSNTQTYFAQVTNGIVTDVHVVSQEFIDANPERYPGTWIETFIDDALNKTYAGVGFLYDSTTNDFVAPPPPVE